MRKGHVITRWHPGLAAVLGAALSFGTASALASTWSERKCELYTAAWNDATRGSGLAGISAEFLASHADFLASGCRAGTVCPRGRAEVALADLLSLMAVAEGMAGSFLPFRCPG